MYQQQVVLQFGNYYIIYMQTPYFGPKVLHFDVKAPQNQTLTGQYAVLQPIQEHHLPSLFESVKDPELWAMVPSNAPKTIEDLRVELFEAHKNYVFYAIKKKGDERVVGVVAYMNALPSYQSIELGFFRYSPDVQRTTLTTEVFYLLAKYAFQDLKFHRVQWKCNKLNERSRRAAERFGFFYEGCWRQDMIEKGFYRDSLYFSILGGEWEQIKQELESWLDASNFDETGKEKRKLALREVREKLNSESSATEGV